MVLVPTRQRQLTTRRSSSGAAAPAGPTHRQCQRNTVDTMDIPILAVKRTRRKWLKFRRAGNQSLMEAFSLLEVLKIQPLEQ